MTRVQKINKAIEILHVQRQMTPREIHQYLRDRGVDVDLPVVVAVVTNLNYVSVSTRSTPVSRSYQLAELLKKVVARHREVNAPWKFLGVLLREISLRVPVSGAEFDDARLHRFLTQHKLLCRSKGKRLKEMPVTMAQYRSHMEGYLTEIEEFQRAIDKAVSVV